MRFKHDMQIQFMRLLYNCFFALPRMIFVVILLTGEIELYYYSFMC